MSEDIFHDVCDECARQIAVAGHDPDCSQITETDHPEDDR